MALAPILQDSANSRMFEVRNVTFHYISPSLSRKRGKVRKAEKGDRGAVLNIDNNVYSGMDYLPYAFDSLIDDPSYIYYVVEVDQQVVR